MKLTTAKRANNAVCDSPKCSLPYRQAPHGRQGKAGRAPPPFRRQARVKQVLPHGYLGLEGRRLDALPKAFGGERTYPRVGDSVHDDDGVDVRLTSSPFLHEDVGRVRGVVDGVPGLRCRKTKKKPSLAQERLGSRPLQSNAQRVDLATASRRASCASTLKLNHLGRGSRNQRSSLRNTT